jgi:predicted nucleotidyltransferase
VNDAKALLKRISDFVTRLDAKLGVEKALLFGSTAKGNRLQESDVDLIVVSKSFKNMSVPQRLGLLQNEWTHKEELQALAYTPMSFEKCLGERR